MASDEELARQIAQVEGDEDGSGSGEPRGFEEFRSTAKEVHDELARRVDRVDERAVDEDELAAVVDRLDRLESRIEALEADA